MKPTIYAEPITLNLKTPFVIAHGASVSRRNVLVHIECDLGHGVGEAALAPYYGISADDIVAYVRQLDPVDLLPAGLDYLPLEDSLDRLPAGPSPARTGVDMALHDLWAQALGRPLFQLWGLNAERAPASSLTIGLTETHDELRRRLRDAAGFPIIKLKLGTGDLAADEAIVRVARETTDAHLCVDANSAWSVSQAAEIIPRLAELGLLFVEQPLPQHGIENWHQLRQHLPAGMPPLIADESVHHAADIPALAGAADGVNIKLAKAGGLREARRMIVLARAMEMQVMLGCMVESSVAVTAGAHLAPWVDYADLDGNFYVANDPYTGATMECGRLILSDRPGLGVERRPIS